MTDIIVRDSLRLSVETASGGAQTVLYSKRGQPNWFNVIPKANIEDIEPLISAQSGLTGVHPAFQVGDKTLSQLFIATYLASPLNGELVSQPNLKPLSFTGNGWSALYNYVQSMQDNMHIMNSIEWQLLSALVLKSGRTQYGNTFNGAWKMLGWSPDDTRLTARRVDGLPPGYTANDANSFNYDRYNTMTLTGSGPSEFNIGHLANGIADVAGNGYHPTFGIRLVGDATNGYECQVYTKNNQTANKPYNIFDLSVDSGWMAIDATTGAFVTPTYTGTLDWDTSKTTYLPTTSNSVRCKQTLTGTEGANFFTFPSGALNSTTNYANIKLPAKVMGILKLYGFLLGEDKARMIINTGTSTGLSYVSSVNVPKRASYDFFHTSWTNPYSGLGDLPTQVRLAYYRNADMS